MLVIMDCCFCHMELIVFSSGLILRPVSVCLLFMVFKAVEMPLLSLSCLQILRALLMVVEGDHDPV